MFPLPIFTRVPYLDSITGQIWPAGRLLRTPALQACSQQVCCNLIYVQNRRTSLKQSTNACRWYNEYHYNDYQQACGQTHCRFVTVSRKNVTKHSLFRSLHFVNFCSPKCRKYHFRGLRNAKFPVGQSPRTPLKGCRHSYFALPDENRSYDTVTLFSFHLTNRFHFAVVTG